jgi:hypothetical protein
MIAMRGSADWTTNSALREQASVAQREVADLELRERALVDQQALKSDAVTNAEIRVAAEERAFWFRRFHTSLAIAHGGALAAIASKLLDGATGRLAVKVALLPMAVFAVGMVLAGSIPYALYREDRQRAQTLANVSAGLFVVGLIVTIGALSLLAYLGT